MGQSRLVRVLVAAVLAAAAALGLTASVSGAAAGTTRVVADPEHCC